MLRSEPGPAEAGSRGRPRFFSRFLRSTRGNAATEFAILVPVMLMMLLTGYELMSAIGASTRATYLATSLAEMLSQSTLTLSTADADRIIETAPVVDPDILRYAKRNNRSDIWKVADVTLSSVLFTPLVAGCTVNCAYRGDLLFSYSQQGPTRPCGQVVPDSTPMPGSSTLPAEVFGPGSVVVVDVKVPYMPLVSDIFGADFSFQRTVYLRPRYVDRINYVKNCTGF